MQLEGQLYSKPNYIIIIIIIITIIIVVDDVV
jgi:hypothetical protein